MRIILNLGSVSVRVWASEVQLAITPPKKGELPVA
jgi:hypothetical protein